MGRIYVSRPPHDRFAEKVSKSAAADGCWLWNGSTMPNGYGRFAVSHGRLVLAHRFAYESAVGAIPEGMLVCHRCDVRNCVRPSHLFLGTQLDNIRDMDAKARRVRVGLKGTAHHKSKLTDDDVRSIRSEYADCRTTLTRLAEKYGVSFSTIGRIVSRSLWRHVA